MTDQADDANTNTPGTDLPATDQAPKAVEPDPQNEGGPEPISTPSGPTSGPLHRISAPDGETVVHVSPANTPGGSSSTPASVAVTDKDVAKNEKDRKPTGTVLYRVHPLDPPEIKNHAEVEDADRLPAKVVNAHSNGTVDLEIQVPNGTVFKERVTQGGDSGQWHYGDQAFAVTETGGPDWDHRPALNVDDRGQVREDAEAESAAGTEPVLPEGAKAAVE